jgi:inorganic pyrophosphatase
VLRSAGRRRSGPSVVTPPDEIVRNPQLGVLPRDVRFRVEVPRGSFVKRRPDGTIDFASPLPCPYNYGSIVGTTAPDGDPLDALVLGPRLSHGTEISTRVWALFGFTDAGTVDLKVVCGPQPLTELQRRGIERFFARYALLKRIVHRVRGNRGVTEALGWQPLEVAAAGGETAT